MFAISSIGTGKSTLLNKLVLIAEKGDKYYTDKAGKDFVAGDSTTGLTVNIKNKKVSSPNLV